MASKDTTVLPHMTETTSSAAEKSITPIPASDQGLAGLTLPVRAPGWIAEVLQKAQLELQTTNKKGKEAVREKTPANKMHPSPAIHPRRYAMEVWIQAETTPGVFDFPEDDTYGADFVIDTLNMAYPGCTGVYLTEAGHVIAFYGKKSSAKSGLNLEQGMEACKILSEIPRWIR